MRCLFMTRSLNAQETIKFVCVAVLATKAMVASTPRTMRSVRHASSYEHETSCLSQCWIGRISEGDKGFGAQASQARRKVQSAHGLGPRVENLGFRVQRAHGLGPRVENLGFRV